MFDYFSDKAEEMYIKHVESSLEAFDAGFASAAAKKRCLEDLSGAYNIMRSQIEDGYIDLRNSGVMTDNEIHELYWGCPSTLNNWRSKHTITYMKDFPTQVERIELLVDMRNSVKETEVVKVVPKNAEYKEQVEKIEKSLKEIFEYKIESYERTLKIAELFKGIPVYVQPHMCFMNNGTRYVRYFYYVHGKLTALSTIMEAVHTHSELHPELYEEK
jgi:hypothetical protein